MGAGGKGSRDHTATFRHFVFRGRQAACVAKRSHTGFFIITPIAGEPMTDDLIYCNQCGRRLAMRFRLAITGRLCWSGRNGEIVELRELPNGTSDSFDWLFSCGHTTTIEDRLPDAAPKQKATVLKFDPSRRQKRKSGDAD